MTPPSRRVLTPAHDKLRAASASDCTYEFRRSSLLADSPKVCELAITGMTCAGCEAAVRIAAKRHAGVRDVTVSYAKGTAVVTYDAGRTTPEAIAQAITKGSGFLAKPR